MLKRLISSLVLGSAALAALILGACAPALTPAPAPTATSTPFPPTDTPAATATPRPATATPAVTAAAQASLFPPVGADEWQKGPADARITIIEYSDYQ